MKRVTLGWIDSAGADYRAAVLVLAGDQPVFEASCFHAQQCAEKYLKALLQEHGIPFPRTHDLTILAQICTSLVPHLATLEADLAELNVYAVETRYPGTDVGPEDAAATIQTAEMVRQLTRTALGLPNSLH